MLNWTEYVMLKQTAFCIWSVCLIQTIVLLTKIIETLTIINAYSPSERDTKLSFNYTCPTNKMPERMKYSSSAP